MRGAGHGIPGRKNAKTRLVARARRGPGRKERRKPDCHPALPNYRIQRYFTLGQLLIVVLDRKSAAVTKCLILRNLGSSEEGGLPGWERFLTAPVLTEHFFGLCFGLGLATEGGHSLPSEAVTSALGRSGNCSFGQEIRSRNEAFDSSELRKFRRGWAAGLGEVSYGSRAYRALVWLVLWLGVSDGTRPFALERGGNVGVGAFGQLWLWTGDPQP